MGTESKGRWNSVRKSEIVLRILRGEDISDVSEELGLKEKTLNRWKEDFIAGGTKGLSNTFSNNKHVIGKRIQDFIEHVGNTECIGPRSGALGDKIGVAASTITSMWKEIVYDKDDIYKDNLIKGFSPLIDPIYVNRDFQVISLLNLQFHQTQDEMEEFEEWLKGLDEVIIAFRVT